MSIEHVCALLAVFGGTLLLISWIGRRTGDAARDTRLMLALGAGFIAVSGVVYVAA